MKRYLCLDSIKITNINNIIDWETEKEELQNILNQLKNKNESFYKRRAEERKPQELLYPARYRDISSDLYKEQLKKSKNSSNMNLWILVIILILIMVFFIGLVFYMNNNSLAKDNNIDQKLHKSKNKKSTSHTNRLDVVSEIL